MIPDGIAGGGYVIECQEGITFAYDDLLRLPNVLSDFGQTGVALFVAHEVAHILQFASSLEFESELKAEIHADCLSGAYLKSIVDGVSAQVDAGAVDLDAAIEFVSESGSQEALSASARQTHGSSFSRLRAMQNGYFEGVNAC